MITSRTLVSAALCLGALVHPASAQTSDEGAPPPSQSMSPPPEEPLEQPPESDPVLDAVERPLEFSLVGGVRQTFQRDFNNAAGEIAVFRSAAGASVDLPIDRRSTLSFSVLAQHSSYDLEDATALAPNGDPFDDLIDLTAGVTFSRRFGERWSAFAGAIVQEASEIGEDPDDSVTFEGGGGVGYTFSEDLSVAIGLFVDERLEDDTTVRPLVRIEWQIDERTRFLTIGPTPFGPGARLERDLDDDWMLTLRALYENREFRLGDDGVAPEGVLEDEEITLGVGLVYQPDETVRASLGVGAVLFQELELENRFGREIVDVETEPTVFVEFTLSIAF